MVPKGWSEHTLDDLALVERGKFSVRPRNDPRYYGGDMPFVQTGDVTSSGTYLKSFSQTLNENGVGVSKVFPKNTILITIAANIGDTAITTFEVACPDSVVAIQPYKHVADVYWLKKYLETRKTDLDAQSTQNAQKNINLQVLKPLLILTPPYAEQKKIAKILSTWDNAISVTEKLLANSQQQKKALMQQLLTGKKRLLDENGVRFSGEWRNSTLSMFCNIAKGKALSASDLEVGDFPVIAGGKSSPYSHSDYTHENVVTVSASGAYAGYISYHNYKIWASDCSVVSAKADNLIDYFYQLLLSLQDKIYSLQSGGAQPHIYPKDLNSIPLWVPCVKEQQKIATVLSAADAEISTLEKKLACLRDEKKALMQQLLTGKRRVKVDEAVAE
ncbi:TPA: restriction endonuclease subunit S [Escherichia coli]|uniref:restriction endonuclease subunit S n=1 Tax=Escherichia coli TaxID=562 RepID=UPI000B50DB96|nr:restriction endonuclease subunit S [Escherichia coli]EFA4980507.1 restriction endonuclease subunit S [Escherichia coli]EFB7213385.1 restriction endonuclease subunit S [Escherichia coli]EFH2621122.1 restriction endonuclease subunit S [Escherichia coli]EFH8327939.1 restriction endonuclease subunit S [Escherichia coli]EFL7387901.1 restriction endonuclease subunit S [Escherichia coli]